nr:hypothetical protein CFP56_65621 [Quercus suber]
MLRKAARFPKEAGIEPLSSFKYKAKVFRRAPASLNALPTSAVAVTEEVVEEAKVAKWSKETNKSTRLQNKTLKAMTLVAVCLTEGVSREVHGSSSGVGTFAIQIAKYHGASVFVIASPISLYF